MIPVTLLDSSFEELRDVDELGFSVLIEPESKLKTFVSERLIIDSNHNAAFNQLTTSEILNHKICTSLTESGLDTA